MTALAATLALGALAGCLEPDPDATGDDVGPDAGAEPALSTDELAIYDYATLPSNLRVAVVLYDFDDTGPNQGGAAPAVNRLPVADVVSAMFTGAGHDLATGSVSQYYYEATDNWMRVSGTVYDWTTLPRHQRVWRRSLGAATCMGGEAPRSLGGSYMCLDPVQPSNGLNTHLMGPVDPTRLCRAGSPSVLPFRPAGNDWCYDLDVVDADLVPTIKAAARSTCGTTDTGARRCGFDERDYDAVIYASPYDVQGTYPGGKTLFAEARVRSYAMYVFAHELGHFLGLSHAQTLVCGPANARVPYAASGCAVAAEYGDGSSLMSTSGYQLSGYEKLASGAISTASLRTITTSGQYAIAKLEQDSPTPRVLRIAVDNGKYFYLDTRHPTLFDGGLTGPFTQGVAVRLAPDHAQRWTHAGASTTWCGASCGAYLRVGSAQLLDMTPRTPGSFSDAPLLPGASYTDPARGLTLQVASKDPVTGGAVVDVTFRPADKKLFFYQPWAGTAMTYWQYAAGGIQYVGNVAGARRTWTHVVGANNGALLWYDAASGAAYTAYIDDGGQYRSRGSVAVGAGWTHIASAGRGNLLFYRAGVGSYMTATIDADGRFTQRSTGAGFDTSWTQITGTLHGGVVFYKASNGQLVTAKLDGMGRLTAWRTPAAAAAGYSHVVAARENGLMFYRASTGAARTAALDDHGDLAWKTTSAAWAAYTQVIGGPNGALFLYNATTGAAYTATMDAGYALRPVGTVGGISPGQIVASAGGK